MPKKFKKGQSIIATLPTGRVVKGFYIEPYGENKHSIYVNEFSGMNGKNKLYKKIRYGVGDESIIAGKNSHSEPFNEQQQSWNNMAEELKKRIDYDEKDLLFTKTIYGDENNKECDKLKRKIKRNKHKLSIIIENINNIV